MQLSSIYRINWLSSNGFYKNRSDISVFSKFPCLFFFSKIRFAENGSVFPYDTGVPLHLTGLFQRSLPVRNSPTGTQQYYHRKIRPDSWQESAFSLYILKQESRWTPCGILCGIFKLAGIYSRNIIMSRNVNQIPARNPARNIMWAQIPARIPGRNLYQNTAVIPVQNYCSIYAGILLTFLNKHICSLLKQRKC